MNETTTQEARTMTIDERTNDGITVTLSFLPITDLVVLTVVRDDVSRAVTVDPAYARDAFDHPMMYVPDPDTFFPIGA